MLNIIKILKKASLDTIEDKVLKHSAALAFYSIFSLIPFLVVIVGIAGIFLDKGYVQTHIFNQFANIIGQDTTIAIQSALENAAYSNREFIPMIFGIIILLVSASGILIHLKDGLNSIWEVENKKRKWHYFIFDYLLSFTLLLGIVFLLIISLIVSTLIEIVSQNISGIILINAILSLIILGALFTILLKYLPDKKVKWEEAAIGGLIISLLFNLGKFLIGFYIGNFNVESAYGLLGSIGAILIWVYYSAIIFFFGAELSQSYSNLKKSG